MAQLMDFDDMDMPEAPEWTPTPEELAECAQWADRAEDSGVDFGFSEDEDDIETPKKQIENHQFPVPIELDWIRRPRDAENIDFDFVLPGLSRGEVGLLAGAGGNGKSFLALEIAYSVASGVRFFSSDGSRYYPHFASELPHKKAKVLNFEDSSKVLWNRIGAIQDYAENLFAITSFEDVYIAECAQYAMYLKILNTRGEINQQTVEWFRQQAAGMDLLVLDPLSQIHAADENNNGQMSMLMSIFKNIATTENVAILIVHHASKGAVLNGQAEVQQATRGASALVDSSRLTMTLLRDAKTKEILLSYPKINGHEPLPTVSLTRDAGGILVEEIPIPNPDVVPF